MTSDRELDVLEDRVRTHLRHRAEGITWDTLRPARPPVPPSDAARRFPGWRRPVLRWVVPVSVGASTALAALAWAVFAPDPGTTTDPAPVPPAGIVPAETESRAPVSGSPDSRSPAPTPTPPSTQEGTSTPSPSPSLPVSAPPVTPSAPSHPVEPGATKQGATTSGYGPTAIPSGPPGAPSTPGATTPPPTTRP